jgi:hypothetical protein
MTHISGWCNGVDSCNSRRAHETCGERIRKGLLARCDCTKFGPHPKPETTTVDRETTPNDAEPIRYDKGNETAPGGVASTVTPGASPTLTRSID